MNTTDRQLQPFLIARYPLPFAALLAVVWLAVPPLAFSDIAPDPISGGVNFSGSTKEVEMSEEQVTLDITATRCTTNAVFQMKNLTDKPVTMEVGFPFAYASDLQAFSVKVDGDAVENVAEKSLGKRQKWYVWTMTFPAGKVTAVEVDYWNDLKAKAGWSAGIHSVPDLLLSFTSFKTKPKGQATEDEVRQFDELKARLQHGNVRYIMKTGAGWAGNIGKCRVEAKFHGFASDSLITRFPSENEEYQFRDPQIRPDGLVWELEDFEPKDDISFQVSPHFTHRELKELIEITLKDHPHHPRLTLLLGEYCESPEEKQRHKKMVDEMLAAWSTRFAIDGPDYIDKEHAQESLQVWFTVRKLTIYRLDENPLDDARRRKLLPTIKAIVQKMQSQLPKGLASTDRLNEYQVKTFRSEADRIFKWTEDQ